MKCVLGEISVSGHRLDVQGWRSKVNRIQSLSSRSKPSDSQRAGGGVGAKISAKNENCDLKSAYFCLKVRAQVPGAQRGDKQFKSSLGSPEISTASPETLRTISSIMPYLVHTVPWLLQQAAFL